MVKNDVPTATNAVQRGYSTANAPRCKHENAPRVSCRGRASQRFCSMPGGTEGGYPNRHPAIRRRRIHGVIAWPMRCLPLSYAGSRKAREQCRIVVSVPCRKGARLSLKIIFYIGDRRQKDACTGFKVPRSRFPPLVPGRHPLRCRGRCRRRPPAVSPRARWRFPHRRRRVSRGRVRTSPCREPAFWR